MNSDNDSQSAGHCFDLPDGVAFPGAVLDTERVIGSLDWISNLLNNEQKSRVFANIDAAPRREDRGIWDKDKAASYPIYSALCGLRENADAPAVLRTLQASALLIFIFDIHKSDANKVFNFLSLFRGRTLKGLIQSLEFKMPKQPTSQDLDKAERELDEWLNTGTNLSPKDKGQRRKAVQALKQALTIIKSAIPSEEKKTNIKRARRNVGRIVQDTIKQKIATGEEDESAFPIDLHWHSPPISIHKEEEEYDEADDTGKVSPSLPPLPTQLTGSNTEDDSLDEPTTRRLGLRGNRMRNNGMFANRSVDSLTKAEFQSCYERLLCPPEGATTPHLAARLVWLLVALLGRRYDDLIFALAGSVSQQPGGILQITLSGNRIKLECAHLIDEDDLPNPQAKRVIKEMHLFVELPALHWIPRAWGYLKNCQEGSSKCQKVLEFKDGIREELREECVPRFIETRFRGTVAQALFQHNFDLPLIQFVFGEWFNHSDAALHYICWTQLELQRQYNEALYSVLPAGQCVPCPGENYRVGAPKAAIFLEALMPLSKWVREEVGRLKEEKDPLRRHNTMAKIAMHVLGVGGGHRQTKALSRVRLADLSLEAGLALFREKPTDPSVYRRIAALPKIVIAIIRWYVRNLELLSELQGRRATPALRNAARRALESKHDLFFLFEESDILPCLPKDIYAEFAPDLALNNHRHMQATALRIFDASALFTEAHLGHQLNAPVFGDGGLIAPIEIAEYLRPFLDRFMRYAGYPAPSEIPMPLTASTVSIDSDVLQCTQKAEFRLDARKIKRQFQTTIRSGASPASCRQVITETLTKFEPRYGEANPPSCVVIDKSQALNIRNSVIERLGDNAMDIFRACKALRVRFRRHKKLHDWQVTLPPPIAWDIRPPLNVTRVNFIAYEAICGFRADLKHYLEQTKKPDLYFAARAALMVWGQCPSWSQSAEWLASIDHKPVRKGDDFLLIDLKINGVTQSRSIHGQALVLVAAWIQAGRPTSRKRLSSVFRGRPSVSDLNTIVKYARYIELPHLWAEVINENLPHRELDRESFYRYIDGTVNSAKIDLNDTSTSIAKKVISKTITNMSVDNQLIKDLKALVRNPTDSEILNEQEYRLSRKNAVKKWTRGVEFSSAIELAVQWAIKLLADGANTVHGGYLAPDTVASYIHDIWEPLSSIARYNIAELTEEDVSELIEDAFSTEPKKQREQMLRFVRFWADMEADYELPKLSLGISGRVASGNIDACVINTNEYKLAKKHIAKWSRNPALKTQALTGSLDGEKLLRLHYETGARRNEIAYLRPADWLLTPSASQVHIHPSRTRRLKSMCSKRVIQLPSGRDDYLFAIADNKYSFSRLTSSPAAFRHGQDMVGYALKAATSTLSAKVHHLRHTKGTSAIEECADSTTLHYRIRGLLGASTDLGHASIKTTINHYSHSCHFSIGRQFFSCMDGLSARALANCFDEPLHRQHLRKQRSKKDGRPLCTAYVGKISAPVERQCSSGKILPTPSRFLLTTENPTLHKVMLWLLLYGRGQQPIAAANGLGFDYETVVALCDNLRTIQNQINWNVIPDSDLDDDIAELHSIEPALISVRRDHKRFPVGWINHAIETFENAALHPNTVLRDALLAMDWRQRGGVFIDATVITIPVLNDAFSYSGLDSIKVEPVKDNPNIGVFVLNDAVAVTDTGKHVPNSMKLILVAYLLADLGVP